MHGASSTSAETLPTNPSPTHTMNPETGSGRTDPILLLEAVLALVLFGLFILLYFRPFGLGDPTPAWWTAPLLGGLFFAILFLERWRRKKRNRAALSRGLSNVPDSVADDGA